MANARDDMELARSEKHIRHSQEAYEPPLYRSTCCAARSLIQCVTSPIGLHGWKHRFAVNRAHLHRYAGPVGAAAVEIWKHRFARSSNWKHTFAIRSIAVDWQAEEKQRVRSEEHTSELQSLRHLVCRLLL